MPPFSLCGVGQFKVIIFWWEMDLEKGHALKARVQLSTVPNTEDHGSMTGSLSQFSCDLDGRLPGVRAAF